MTVIKRSTPIYEALLYFAEPDEKEIILNGGPREKLMARLTYGDGIDGNAKARHAYNTMDSIIIRVSEENHFKLTGIDVRQIPPSRIEISWELLIAGDIRWRNVNGIESELELAWTETEPLRIINLEIEPRKNEETTLITSMRPSAILKPGHRKNDNERLALMQKFIDEGMRPKTAARQVLLTMPDKNVTDDSFIRRLCNRYRVLSRM